MNIFHLPLITIFDRICKVANVLYFEFSVLHHDFFRETLMSYSPVTIDIDSFSSEYTSLFLYAAYTIDEVNEKTKAFRESAKQTPVINSSGIDVIDVSYLITLSRCQINVDCLCIDKLTFILSLEKPFNLYICCSELILYVLISLQKYQTMLYSAAMTGIVLSSLSSYLIVCLI